MKKSTKIIIAVVIIILIAAVAEGLYLFGNFNSGEQEQQLSGTIADKETGGETGYSLEILKRDDIQSPTVTKWISDSLEAAAPDSQGYYTLYNNASESMDMYLFMPAAKEVMGNIDVTNVKAVVSGTTLMLSVDTGDKTKNTKESTDLIFHIKAGTDSDVTQAKSERLSVNGKAYSCLSSTFAVVR